MCAVTARLCFPSHSRQRLRTRCCRETIGFPENDFGADNDFSALSALTDTDGLAMMRPGLAMGDQFLRRDRLSKLRGDHRPIDILEHCRPREWLSHHGHRPGHGEIGPPRAKPLRTLAETHRNRRIAQRFRHDSRLQNVIGFPAVKGAGRNTIRSLPTEGRRGDS